MRFSDLGLPPGTRFLEIGDGPLVWHAFPEATDFFGTASLFHPNRPEDGLRPLTLGNWPGLLKRLASPDLGLVIVRPHRLPPWSLGGIVRTLSNRRALRGDIASLARFGSYVRVPRAVPVAIVDQDDVPLIMPHNFRLLDRAAAYFMRELPADRWRAFMTTGHRDLPPPRLRRAARWRSRVEKLHPISLGLPSDTDTAFAVGKVEKTVDVFFAGAFAANSWLRERGRAELAGLAREGFRIDIDDGRLPREQFYARLAGAWLAWSPEGLGHDCFRHYEAPFCGTVPVISRAPNERHMPLVEGTHAFYYDPEPGGLAETVRRALADRERLVRMGEAGRTHVLAHHTSAALGRHVVAATLAAARRD